MECRCHGSAFDYIEAMPRPLVRRPFASLFVLVASLVPGALVASCANVIGLDNVDRVPGVGDCGVTATAKSRWTSGRPRITSGQDDRLEDGGLDQDVGAEDPGQSKDATKDSRSTDARIDHTTPLDAGCTLPRSVPPDEACDTTTRGAPPRAPPPGHATAGAATPARAHPAPRRPRAGRAALASRVWETSSVALASRAARAAARSPATARRRGVRHDDERVHDDVLGHRDVQRGLLQCWHVRGRAVEDRVRNLGRSLRLLRRPAPGERRASPAASAVAARRPIALPVRRATRRRERARRRAPRRRRATEGAARPPRWTCSAGTSATACGCERRVHELHGHVPGGRRVHLHVEHVRGYRYIQLHGASQTFVVPGRV